MTTKNSSKSAIKESIYINDQVNRCLLCYDPPCTKACGSKSSPAEFIRSLRFSNIEGAKAKAKPLMTRCLDDNTLPGCQAVCIRAKIDRAVDIRSIHRYLLDKNE